jgi:hypothetical protein
MAAERATCPICKRDIAVSAEGRLRPHNRTIVFNPEAAPEHRESHTAPCRGSGREAKEHQGRKLAGIRAKAAERRKRMERR